MSCEGCGAITAADLEAAERAAGERALREAASDIVADCTNQSGPCICAARHWLRDRADQIGGER